MPILDIFSKRKAAENRTSGDVYQYDDAPNKLRVQIVHIFSEAIGNEEDYHNNYGYKETKATFAWIVNALRKEYGVFRLGGASRYDSENERDELLKYLLSCPIDHFLDIIEMGGRLIENYCSKWNNHEEVCREAINEINVRLRESSFGYQFEGGQVIRVDVEFAHQQITKPAIAILNSKHLRGAREEFLNAHTHYRERRYKECIVECLKSFESAMKAICSRLWTH
jgi:AbiJ N-terminal domain 4